MYAGTFGSNKITQHYRAGLHWWGPASLHRPSFFLFPVSRSRYRCFYLLFSCKPSRQRRPCFPYRDDESLYRVSSFLFNHFRFRYICLYLLFTIPRWLYRIFGLLYLERGFHYTCFRLLLTVPQSLYRTSCLLYSSSGPRYIFFYLLFTHRNTGTVTNADHPQLHPIQGIRKKSL